jgi:hypothetical protein
LGIVNSSSLERDPVSTKPGVLHLTIPFPRCIEERHLDDVSVEFFRILHEWRAAGELKGLELRG